MIQGGARTANVAEPLVFYRVGETAFKRRGGMALLRSELRLQREFRRSGFTSPAEYVRNVVVRGGYRLIPWWLRRAVYRPLVALLSRPAERQSQVRARPEPPDWEFADEWRNPDMFAAGLWDEPTAPVSQ
jgi:hypothetical protein